MAGVLGIGKVDEETRGGGECGQRAEVYARMWGHGSLGPGRALRALEAPPPFRNDGSRGFPDALTVMRERAGVVLLEPQWAAARERVSAERAHVVVAEADSEMDQRIAGMTAAELREVLAKVPQAVVRRAIVPRSWSS